MRQRIWIGIVLLVGLAAAPARGQQVEMKWKFTKGETFYIEADNRMKQTMTVANQNLSQDMENPTLTAYKVIETGPDKTVLEQTTEKVKFTMKGGLGAPFAGTMEELAGKLKGTTLKITLAPDGKVLDFTGFEQIADKVAKDNPQMGAILKLVLNKETMAKSAEQSFTFLPDKPVKPGDTWTLRADIPMSGLGSMRTENTYKYEGKAPGGEKITYTMNLSYVPPGKNDVSPLPAKITRGELKSEGARGTIIFDAARGKLVSHELTMHLKGSMTMDTNGKEMTMDMDQEQTTTIKALDKKPAD